MAANIYEQATAPTSLPAPTPSLTDTTTSNSIFMPPTKTTTKNVNLQADSLLFGKLPGELRNRIWRLSVLDESAVPIHVVHYKNKEGSPRSCIQIEHTLLQVCKQARHEVTDIYYLENTFRITQDLFSGRAMEVLACAMKPWAAKMTTLEVAHELKYIATRSGPRKKCVAINLTVLNSEGRIVVVPSKDDIRIKQDMPPMAVQRGFFIEVVQLLCCCKIFSLADEYACEDLLAWAQRYVNLVQDSQVEECGFIPRCWGCTSFEVLGHTKE